MMNKSKSVFLLPFFLLVFLGCATAPKTAFDREKMNVVNLMGYSNNEVNIQVAKDIWNNKIVVNVLDNTSEYYAVFDLTNPKVVSIVFDSKKEPITAVFQTAYYRLCVCASGSFN